MGSFKKRFSVLVVLSIIGYVLSFCNQLVISYYFGTSSMLDAYWAALAIANFLCFYLHPLKEAIVPAAYRSSRISMEEASDMLSAGITFLGLLVGVSTAVMFFSPGFLVDWFTNSGDPDQQLLKLLPWFIPFLFLFSLSEILSSVLLGFNKNVTQATARLVASIASLVTLILLSPQLGVKALVLSLLVNQLVVILVSIWSLSGLQIKLKLASVNILKKQHVFTLFSSLFFSYLVAQLYILVERNVMMQLSTGLLSSYQYSTALVNVLLSMIAFPLANLLWHRFLEANHTNDKADAQLVLLRAIGALFLILLPICAFAYLNSKSIIFIIYSRGAFDAQSLQITVEAFRATIFTAIPIGIYTLIGRYLISSHHPKYSAVTGVSIAVSSIVIVLISSYINSTNLIVWNWFIGNIVGLVVSLQIILQNAVSMKQGTFRKWGILISQSSVIVFLVSLISPDFSNVDMTKAQVILAVSYNFIFFVMTTCFLAKLSGVTRRVRQLIYT